jgi:hypothetical protein
MNIAVNGQTQLALPPEAAPVTLLLQGILNSDGLKIGGWQHALKAGGLSNSQAALWNFGPNPVVSFNTAIDDIDNFEPGTVLNPDGFADWGAADIAFSQSNDASLPGTNGGEISIFRNINETPAYAGRHVITIRVTSKAPLSVGFYSFTFGNSGNGFFLVSSDAPGGAPFAPGNTFTLLVGVPEPATALLLLSALPLLRRRRPPMEHPA